MNTLNQQDCNNLAELLAYFKLSASTVLSNLVGGELLSGTGTDIHLINPATGKELISYQDAGAEIVNQAVTAASTAQIQWQALSASERGRRMLKAISGLNGHEEKLAQLESVVSGKPIRDCRAEVTKVREMFEYYAGWCDKVHGEVIPVPTSHLNYVQYVPYGVVGQITPWNAPMFTCAWQLAPAIAAGNGVVLKPSELTPFSSVVIAALLEQSGLPKGLINIVNGAGPETGASLTAHDGIAKLVFVGSPAGGQAIAMAAAKRLVPSVLELGGKSANIIFPDANIDDAVAGAQAAIFGAAGQSCVAGSRLLVHESIINEVCDRLARACPTIKLGLPSDEQTKMGPVQNIRQFSKIKAMIARAVEQGAQLVTGGDAIDLPADAKEGFFIAPTVLRAVNPDMEIANQEVFGPVLVVMSFKDEADAIKLANATRFGLAGAVWTQDPALAHRVANQLRAGTVWINSYKAINVMSPFGGFRDSGYGRSSGLSGLHEYLVARSVWVETAPTASVAMGYGVGD